MSKFKDIDLKFTKKSNGDINTLENGFSIKQSLKNLVLISYNERPFHPEKGCGVYNLLFENNSPITKVHIRDKVIEVIENFEPRVKLIEVNVEGEQNEITISIVYQNNYTYKFEETSIKITNTD